MDPVTLVLGGTGKTGRRIVGRLEDRGIPVRAASRSAEPAFAWETPSTWEVALRDVESVYLSYSPDLAAPGASTTVREFVELAAKSGVRRVVLLSGRGEPEAEVSERTVRDSGLAWTIVRSAWFSQNFSEDYLLDAVLAGEVALPAGDVPEPFVDADDIADVAVAALTEGGHTGQLYEVTGPRLLTFADAVDEIARAAGREIRFIPISLDQYAEGAVEHGVPADLVELLTYLFGEVLDGRNAHVTDGVERALGRPPRDFRDYAQRTAATGVWHR